MRLLVSVRSAAEATAALEGGAQIVDAKEPARGSLGPVTAAVLREIAGVVPPDIPLSAALGDVATAVELRRSLQILNADSRPGGLFVKLGFAGVRSETRIAELLNAARIAVSSLSCRPALVAVAYADHRRAGVPAPGAVVRLAVAAGASGVLLDTAGKDGKGLTDWMPGAELAAWVADVRQAGLFTALAGGLAIDSLEPVLRARPDIVGVRGAACRGGRDGMVESAHVRTLVTTLANGRLAKRHVGTTQEVPIGHSSH